MIAVKLYGLLRIESGIREKQLEASSVKEVLAVLADCGISATVRAEQLTLEEFARLSDVLEK